MRGRRLGLSAAAVATLLWASGSLAPWDIGYLATLDLRWYFAPSYEAFYASARRGTLMLWNPYQLCGIPWVGTLQSGFFYPPHALYLVLPTPWALAVVTCFHVALAVGGAVLFAWRAGVSGPGSALAAAVFATTGPLREWQLWPYLLEAGAWLPFGALGVLELTGRRRRLGILTLAFASGMSWLAGSPQVTLASVYAWAALLLARLLGEGIAPAAAARIGGGFCIALAGGLLLGAAALLPAWDVARDSVRSGGALSVTSMYPFGLPEPMEILRGWLEPESRPILLGALVLFPLSMLGAQRALAIWALALGSTTIALAMGPSTRAFDLYAMLPFLAWFRIPHRILFLSNFALGIAAGLGLDVLATRLRRPRLSMLVGFALIAILIARGILTPRVGQPLPYRRGTEPWSTEHRERYAALARSLDGARVFPYTPDPFRRPLPPKLPSLAKIRSIEDYEPLTLRRQAEFFTFFRDGTTRDRSRVAFRGRITSLTPPEGQPPPAARRRLLDLAAVKLVLVSPPARMLPEFRRFADRAALVHRPALATGIDVLENPHALPRAFFTYRVRPAPPTEELLSAMSRFSFDPLAQSFVEADAGFEPAPDAPARGGPAEIVRDEPHVVELEATLTAPGIVVLADTHHRGWTATVNGNPAPIVATNHLFRGVVVPAGNHRLRFEYSPRAVWCGVALSLFAACALAIGWGRIARAAS